MAKMKVLSTNILLKCRGSRWFSHRRTISPTPDQISSLQLQYEKDNEWAKSQEGKQFIKHFIESSPKETVSSNNLVDYIHKRSHLTKGGRIEKQDEANRIISSLLTYPLTLGHAINEIFPHGFIKPNLDVLIIGARGESSLPYQWWKEMLLTLAKVHHSPDMASIPHSVNLRMTGPHLQHNPSIFKPKRKSSSDNTATENDHFRYSLHDPKFADLSILHHATNPTPQTQHDKLFLHQHKQLREVLLHTDLFVLFHPGFGSPQNQKNWRETFHYLLATRKPILCTAHSLVDYEQDMATVQQWVEEEDFQELSGKSVEFLVAPKQNPFASLRCQVHQYQPSFPPDQTSFTTDELEIVTTNQYVYAFQAK